MSAEHPNCHSDLAAHKQRLPNYYDAYATQDTQYSATVTLQMSGRPSGATEGRTDYWTLSVWDACDLAEKLSRALAASVAPRRSAPELRPGEAMQEPSR